MSLYKEIFKCNRMNNFENIAIRCDDIELSYKELQIKVKNLALEFLSLGVSPGCKVMIAVKHPINFTLTILALNYLDAIAMPIYYYTGIDKINQIINKYTINYLVCDENLVMHSLYSKIKIVEENLNFYKYNFEIDYKIKDIEMILFTSGTTNIPKAIMLTKTNIMSNVIGISKYLKLKNDDRVLIIKNLCHASSIIGELFVGLFNGTMIIMTNRLLTSALILHIIEKNKISIFFAVPTILNELRICSKINEFDFSSLRIINFYGAAIHRNDLFALLKLFKSVNLIYSYGQTEASPRITYIEKCKLFEKPASSGLPLENVIVKIFDNNDCEVPPMQIGEIVIQGPNIMAGYYLDDKLTSKVVKNGTLFTGDIGYLDKDGYLFVTGRKDNMIIISGKNVYPEEIENVLCSHEFICEALVLLDSIEKGMEKLIAYVVVKENCRVSIQEILNICKSRLENYKIPYQIYFVNELKKNYNGKIIRKHPFSTER